MSELWEKVVTGTPEVNFRDIHGKEIGVGDIVLRDGTFLELVEFQKGAYISSIIWPDYVTYSEHIGLFYHNWTDYKKQGLEIIAKDVL